MDIKEFIKTRIAEVEAERDGVDTLADFDAGYFEGVIDAYHVILNSIK